MSIFGHIFLASTHSVVSDLSIFYNLRLGYSSSILTCNHGNAPWPPPTQPPTFGGRQEGFDFKGSPRPRPSYPPRRLALFVHQCWSIRIIQGAQRGGDLPYYPHMPNLFHRILASSVSNFLTGIIGPDDKIYIQFYLKFHFSL